jgi:threonine synthase
MWKAFEELEAIGWIPRGHRPRMISVQAEGCAPIVRAFEQGRESAEPPARPHTIADGLRVPRAVGDFLMLRVIRESGGTAIAVSDDAMVEGMRRLGRTEGISAAPEGGATVAALEVLVARGLMARDELVVLFNTGGALKYLEVLG